ncbi:MAG: alpha/beta hydrolase [Pseudomonadota bacterium]
MSLHSLFHLLLVVFITWCGIAVYLYFSQSRLLYYPDMPSRALEASPADIGLAYETVLLTAGDDTRLHAWFVPSDAARGTLLFNHGNAGNIAHRLDSISLFHSLGLNVLIFDYRGYGESEGKPSEKGTYLDVKAAWDYLLKERMISAEEIVIFGRSLGAAIAVDLASQHPSAGVILESAFTSVPDMAASLYPWLPVRLLSRYRYNSLKRIEGIRSPLLVVHSRDDEIIPYEHGKKLFAQANKPKQFLELNGGHNNGYQVSRKLYEQTMQQFLDAILPLPVNESTLLRPQ